MVRAIWKGFATMKSKTSSNLVFQDDTSVTVAGFIYVMELIHPTLFCRKFFVLMITCHSSEESVRFRILYNVEVNEMETTEVGLKRLVNKP